MTREEDCEMNVELYNALAQRYYQLQTDRRNAIEQRAFWDAKYKIIDEEMTQLNDILCKFGDHIYEHFESESEV